ncbi:uncharacterized protein LAESUDRAFT_757192 [Laetiporus sulphureus 93-53]|uniref:Protein BNI4 n=1 Tax=Laetiporus sulphureus 93-53 TaxID=1314785 RepID=A0A165FID0_9APHY|nr:uncharacterized protein LAESUDRAFT_757192 [Laetiporus sulphureus 93-53]KZT09015.1 hypothetical protein LAESUDRAFT_757192 [Laetiporus sulphureus 93-53]
MAVLAPQDWHPPRDHTMDAAPSAPSATTTTTTAPASAPNPAVPRQRSSPPNDPGPNMAQQQPYPYPVQQQQAGWSSPPPQQFYPAFYQNQQAYSIHAQQQMHPQNAYYDPANAQFAQWAYQQMMYNAQQQAHQMSHVPPHMGQSPSSVGSQRSRGSNPPSADYFALNQMPGFSPFPSGTPPSHPAQLPQGYLDQQQGQYQGFHPYRRPPRSGGSSHDGSSQAGDWRAGPQQIDFHPPYARSDAAGSSSSVNSGSSHQSGSQRPRTNSTQGSPAGGSSSGVSSHSHNHSHPKPPPGSSSNSSNGHGRGGSTTSVTSQGSNAPSPRMHTRTASNSSSNASAPSSRPSGGAASASPAAAAVANLRKPSPLSQGTFTAAEKRMSRDDSDLAAMLEPIPNAPGVRSGGLKGRLRRALSLGANATLLEENEEEDHKGSRSAVAGSSSNAADDAESTATVQKKKSRSLFNSRLNRSTDNISLSSTMSSASMVIRKLGSIGKLTRRNSLAGITSLFKDKKDKEEEDSSSGKKGKKKKGEKASVAEASVSHATVELDRADWSGNVDLAGLSPAAQLARQHTLKSNAEAAAKAKAEQEARALAAAAAAQEQERAVPPTWEKSTTTSRHGEVAPNKLGFGKKVNEEGMRLVVEEDSDSASDGGHGVGYNNNSNNTEGWEDDEDWGEAQEDEDMTIRQDLDNTNLDGADDMEPWAVNVRRSIEKARRPAKGILKMRADGTGYEQDAYLQPNSGFTRVRSNSYDSAPSHPAELGPLARIPSPDPDHIDGLHRHTSPHGSVNGHSSPGFIPPLSFEGNGLTLESPKDSDASSVHSAVHEKTLFSHPNSSAPALSTSFSSPNPPTLSQRSATAPTKRLAFASNLSVYDTFPSTVYDRRSEPATWSRLTPALAQRIKEELNSYKMEEMEVHAASRVHTQFFV